MASHVVLQPDHVGGRSLVDAAPHRAALPPVYNQYSRVAAEPDELRAIENERALFFPLFITSYFLYDFLRDNDFFGAEQVILGSASSKTAFGLAYLLHEDPDGDPETRRPVVGLTSDSNVGFVQSLGTYEHVVPYAGIEGLEPGTPTVFVDMAGSADLIRRVHEHFGDQLEHSCIVGATHWEADRERIDLPGPEPVFFFAPGQIQKREKDWGRGVAIAKANQASAEIVRHALDHLKISRRSGADAVQASLLALLDNEVPPSHGLLLSMEE